MPAARPPAGAPAEGCRRRPACPSSCTSKKPGRGREGTGGQGGHGALSFPPSLFSSLPPFCLPPPLPLRSQTDSRPDGGRPGPAAASFSPPGPARQWDGSVLGCPPRKGPELAPLPRRRPAPPKTLRVPGGSGARSGEFLSPPEGPWGARRVSPCRTSAWLSPNPRSRRAWHRRHPAAPFSLRRGTENKRTFFFF